jgi:hypothetical protein
LSGAFATCQHALQRSSEEMISDVWVDAMAAGALVPKGGLSDARSMDAEIAPFSEFYTEARA